MTVDVQLWYCGLAAVGSSSLDLDSEGLDIGPMHPSSCFVLNVSSLFFENFLDLPLPLH